MKNILPGILFLLLFEFSFAQTATDFTVNDCSGVSRNLFSELNSGKVVVLDWVMPCGACLGATLTAYNIVQSYQTTHPGKVLFYLLDDFGDTPCTALNGWANSNGVGANRITISSTSATQNPYSGFGMPKVVVVGGGNHTVFMNADGSAAGNANDIQNAINQALVVAGIEQNQPADFHVSVTNINPQQIQVNFTTDKHGDVSIEVLNSLGQSVKSAVLNNQAAGNHQTEIFFERSLNGIYFLRISSKENTGLVKFIIAN